MDEVVRQQQRDRQAEAERRRLLNRCRARPALTRRAAAPLGRALIYVGARLLRYGRTGEIGATAPYRAPSRSIGLN
jgi:hypothetical protein